MMGDPGTNLHLTSKRRVLHDADRSAEPFGPRIEYGVSVGGHWSSVPIRARNPRCPLVRLIIAFRNLLDQGRPEPLRSSVLVRVGEKVSKEMCDQKSVLSGLGSEEEIDPGKNFDVNSNTASPRDRERFAWRTDTSRGGCVADKPLCLCKYELASRKVRFGELSFERSEASQRLC